MFAGERIGVGLKKGKFDYAASTNSGSRRPGMNGPKKKEGEAHVVAAAPAWPKFPQAPYNPMYQYPPQYHYSANVNTPPGPIPLQPRTPNQPQRPPLNRPQNPLHIHPRPNTAPNPNLNTNPRRDFPEKKPVQFTPIPMTYMNLLSYLIDNNMAVLTPGKIYQPPFP